MKKLQLGFGNGYQEVTLPRENLLAILNANEVTVGLTGSEEVARALEQPIGAPKLAEVVRPGEKIAIITSDITRPCPTRLILPPVLDRLYAAGVRPEDITLVFALGSHRPHTQEEKQRLAGERAWSEIRGLDSDPGDCVHMGTTRRGTPVDITRVVAEVSWRAGFRMLAAIGAALLFVSTFLLLREKPSDLGMLPYGLKTDAAAGGDAAPVQLPEAVGLTRAEALRTPALWLHVLGFFIILLCGMGVNPHIISYLTDIGYSEGLASTVVSLVMTCMIFAKISMGALFDKIGAVWASVFVGCCVILSMAALALCPLSPIMPYAFAFFFGFAYSIGSVTQPFLCSENYGQKEFSAIYSLAAMLSGVLSSIGPTLIGSMYDSFGSYAKVWPILAVLGAVATVSLTASSLLARKNGYNPNRIGAKKK